MPRSEEHTSELQSTPPARENHSVQLGGLQWMEDDSDGTVRRWLTPCDSRGGRAGTTATDAVACARIRWWTTNSANSNRSETPILSKMLRKAFLIICSLV